MNGKIEEIRERESLKGKGSFERLQASSLFAVNLKVGRESLKRRLSCRKGFRGLLLRAYKTGKIHMCDFELLRRLMLDRAFKYI